MVFAVRQGAVLNRSDTAHAVVVVAVYASARLGACGFAAAMQGMLGAGDVL